jgi:hypothetical protein
MLVVRVIMDRVQFLFTLATEKLLAAMFATKVERPAVTLGAWGGRFINRHAADGVNRHDGISSPSIRPSLSALFGGSHFSSTGNMTTGVLALIEYFSPAGMWT